MYVYQPVKTFDGVSFIGAAFLRPNYLRLCIVGDKMKDF